MPVTLRPASELDFAFTFEAKRQALGPYIVARWHWDESFQLAVHRRRWLERPWLIVESKGRAIGTVAISVQADHIHLAEVYLLPPFQGQGIGTRLLQKVMALADESARPIRLQYLKWNPVGSLYRRHEFIVVAENDTHYFLERAPHGVEKAAGSERGAENHHCR